MLLSILLNCNRKALLMTTMLEKSETLQYLEKTVRSWLGISKSLQTTVPVMPEYLQRLFLRIEEYENPCRDQWGEWEHPYSENYQLGKLWVPEVDEWVRDQRSKYQKVNTIPLWPNDKKFAVMLSHDVDIVSDTVTLNQRLRNIDVALHAGDLNLSLKRKLIQLSRILLGTIRAPTSKCPDQSKTLDVCYAIEKEFGVYASYFFTVYPLDKISKYDCLYAYSDPCCFLGKTMTIAGMMQRLYDDGHDVGLHGSYFSACEPGLLKNQKSVLEKALGRPVTTTRQHWLNWNILQTPQIQSESGILADTTLGFNRNIGFRAGTSLPFYFFDVKQQRELPLLQVPLIIQDGALVGASALEYNEEMAKKAIKRLIDQVINVNGCCTLLFHPDKYIDKRFGRLYRWAIEYALEENGWVTSLKEIHQWWKQREQLLENGMK